MADTKLSDLSAATSVGGTDLLYTVQTAGVGGVKATVQQLATTLTGSTTLTGATVTSSKPLLDLSQTWNASGVTFTGLKFNVTDTASAAASMLLDLQVGGSSLFKVSKSGSGTFSGALTSVYNVTSTLGNIGLNSPTGSFYWRSTGTSLYSDANNVLDQRNGTNAQTFRVYNTYTDQSNFERGVFDWTTTANTLTIGTQKAGTGSTRAMALAYGGTVGATLTTTGLLALGTGITASFPALKQSSASIAFRLADDSADAAISALTGTFTDTSANTSAIAASSYSLTGSSAVSMVDLSGTWNTTGTPTAIKLNLTDTASAAGSLLMDLQVGGTSKFKIGKGGAVTLTGSQTFADATDIIVGATTGSKIGTATSQKIGFWNAAPVVQPTTAVTAATFAANTSGIADDTATFDGYTIGQVVKALRNVGMLA